MKIKSIWCCLEGWYPELEGGEAAGWEEGEEKEEGEGESEVEGGGGVGGGDTTPLLFRN